MINMAYSLQVWKTYRGLILFGIMFTAFLQFIILWVFSTIDYIPLLEVFFNQLPPQLRMIFDQDFMNRLSVSGMAAFGFNHPMVLLLLGLVAVSIPARQIAGYAEIGILELLLAYPFTRSNLFRSLWLTSALILLVIILGGLSGSISTLLAKNLITPVILGGLIRIVINLWVLFVLIMTYTLLLSSFSHEGGRVGFISAAITLVFYLFNFITSLWDRAAFLRPFTIFNYYQPQRLMLGEIRLWYHLIILGCLIAICFGIGIQKFARRDIP